MIVLISFILNISHFFMYSDCVRRRHCPLPFATLYYVYHILFCIQVYRNVIHETFSICVNGVFNIALLLYELRFMDASVDQHTMFRSKCQIPQFEALLKHQQICSICLEELTHKSICGKQCTHLFHADCIYTWALGHVQCPMCRSPI